MPSMRVTPRKTVIIAINAGLYHSQQQQRLLFVTSSAHNHTGPPCHLYLLGSASPHCSVICISALALPISISILLLPPGGSTRTTKSTTTRPQSFHLFNSTPPHAASPLPRLKQRAAMDMSLLSEYCIAFPVHPWSSVTTVPCPAATTCSRLKVIPCQCFFSVAPAPAFSSSSHEHRLAESRRADAHASA